MPGTALAIFENSSALSLDFATPNSAPAAPAACSGVPPISFESALTSSGLAFAAATEPRRSVSVPSRQSLARAVSEPPGRQPSPRRKRSRDSFALSCDLHHQVTERLLATAPTTSGRGPLNDPVSRLAHQLPCGTGNRLTTVGWVSIELWLYVEGMGQRQAVVHIPVRCDRFYWPLHAFWNGHDDTTSTTLAVAKTGPAKAGRHGEWNS